MAMHQYTPVRGKMYRLTELDKCGRVIASSRQIVDDNFIDVALSAEVEDGQEILQTNMAGAICVNERTSPTFKGFTVEINFCGASPGVFTTLTNAQPYTDYAGDFAGFTVPEGAVDKRFALEVWTGLSGQARADGADDASGYMLLPFINAGVVADIEVTGEDAVTFGMTGAYTLSGTQWGQGPYNVVYNGSNVASALPTPLDTRDHLLLIDTGLAVPTPTNDLVPVVPVTTSTTTTTTTN